LVEVRAWSKSKLGQGQSLVKVKAWSRSKLGRGQSLVEVKAWSRPWAPRVIGAWDNREPYGTIGDLD